MNIVRYAARLKDGAPSIAPIVVWRGREMRPEGRGEGQVSSEREMEKSGWHVVGRTGHALGWAIVLVGRDFRLCRNVRILQAHILITIYFLAIVCRYSFVVSVQNRMISISFHSRSLL